MKRPVTSWLWMAVLAASLASAAHAQTFGPGPQAAPGRQPDAGQMQAPSAPPSAAPGPQAAPGQAPQGPPEFVLSRAISSMATVQSVDVMNGSIQLKGPDGKNFTLQVGPQVSNFERLQNGDRVLVRYHDAAAFYVAKAGEPAPPQPSPEGASVGTGSLPSVELSRMARAEAVVQAIDPQKQTMTLLDPKAGVVTINVPREVRSLEQMRVGDRVTVDYSRAFAVSLERR